MEEALRETRDRAVPGLGVQHEFPEHRLVESALG